MIIETTHYHAKPGEVENVLKLRRRGVALRAALGLAPGEIFVRREGAGADVKWECRFVDRAAFEADLAARDRSSEFGEQRRAMGALLEKFERQVFELVSNAEPAP